MGGVAMSEQLSLFDGRAPTGSGCPHWDGEFRLLDAPGEYFRDICIRNGAPTAVICSRSVFGEPPRCAYDEPDNSEAARKRRLEWLREHDSD